MNNLPADPLAIPDEERASSQRGWNARLSTSFACASLACSLSFWIVFVLYHLFGWLQLSPPGWQWVVSLTSPQWTLFEAFGLLLAIVATVLGLLRAKLWRIALPLSVLLFLFTWYVMVS